MSFDPQIAARRFGTGLSPVHAPPQSVAAMMEALRGPDLSAARWPVPEFATAKPDVFDFRAVQALIADPATEAEGRAQKSALAVVQREKRHADFSATLIRAVHAPDGLRERLVQFWAGHFALRSRNFMTTHLVTPFVENAIRPHVAGDFATMLRAVVTHPMMVTYLDQTASFGPNSRNARGRGLNENLAREVLELHTLGADGPYTQDDVIQFAEALTGLIWSRRGMEPEYRAAQAEPGAETVLGVTYYAVADMAVIHAILDDLARHPATARHLARKMARHFVADTPDPALVTVMAEAYGTGDLAAMTEAMLTHPAAWSPMAEKVRQPFDYVVAACRALNVPEAALFPADLRQGQRDFRNFLALMGQSWEDPPDPSGWPEAGEAWIAAQFLAARIDWAMKVPARLLPDLPDPRDVVGAAFADPPPEVVAAVEAAEDRRTGLAVILASAAFQRR